MRLVQRFAFCAPVALVTVDGGEGGFGDFAGGVGDGYGGEAGEREDAGARLLGNCGDVEQVGLEGDVAEGDAVFYGLERREFQ